MKTREEALNYALSFAETYQDAPFRDQNWQLVRVKKSKKAFLWTYEKEGRIWLNVKVNPDPEHIPCFRVVNGKGELAGEFAFGGEGGQSRLLEEDGIPVENGRVDLEKYGITLRE